MHLRGFTASEAAKKAWQSFVELRRAQAAALFELAQKAHAEKQFALSYDLVREACREDPDHAAARAILGYVRYRDRWELPDTRAGWPRVRWTTRSLAGCRRGT